MALRTLLNRLVNSRKKPRTGKGDKSLGQLSEWFSSPDLLNPEDLTQPSAAILNFYSSECTGRPVSMFITSDTSFFSQEDLSSSAFSSSMDNLGERSYSDDCLLDKQEHTPPAKKRASRLFKKVTSPFTKKTARDSGQALKKSLSTPMMIDPNEQKLPKLLKRESSIMTRSWEMSRHRRSTVAMRRAKRLSGESPAGSRGGSFSCDEGDPFPSPTSKSPTLGSEKKHIRTSSSSSLGKLPSPLTRTNDFESSSRKQADKSAGSDPSKERRYIRSSSGSQATRCRSPSITTPESKRSSSTPRGRSSSPAFALRDLSHSPIGKREESASLTSEGCSSPVSRSSASSRQRDGSSATSKSSARCSTSSASSAFDSSEEEPASLSSDSPYRASGGRVGRNVSAAEKSWQHRRKEKLFLKNRRSHASGELPYRETLIN